MLLFKVGLLTLTIMDSLIFLAGNTLPQDSTASQEVSAVSPYNIPPREGSINSTISQEGSLGNTRSQAGNRLTSSQAVRHSTRLRASQASQADNATPQVDSRVSPVSSNSSQVVRHSTRHNASQADSTISQVDSGASQASRSSSPFPGN